MNAFDALNEEISRVEYLRHIYEELPGGVGHLAIAITIDPALKAAKQARSEMDAVAIVRSLAELREITE